MNVYTIVRLKSNREPVAVFDEVADYKTIGFLVDDITTPSHCEYKDVEIETPVFSVKFHQSCKDYEGLNEHSKFDYMAESASIEFDDFYDKLISEFDNNEGWIDLINDFDYLQNTKDVF